MSPKSASNSKSKSASRSGEDLIRIIREFSPQFKGLFNREEMTKFGFRSPIVIRGMETYRTKRLVALIHELIFGKDPSSLSGYFPGEVSSNSIVDSLRAEALGGSLFSKGKIVAFYEYDTIRPNIGEKLLPLFELPSSSTLFVLVTASDKNPKWLEDPSSIGTIFEVQPLSGPALSKWIEKELFKNGHNGGIQPQALDILVRSFGEDTSRLVGEIAKLTLFCEPAVQIAKKDIQALVLSSPDANTFELIEACAQKQPDRVLAILSNLFEQGFHPLQILALFSKAFRSLLAAKDRGPEPLHSELSNPWILRNLPISQKMFSIEELRGGIGLLSALDLGLKGSKREGPDLLKDLLISLSTRTPAIRAGSVIGGV